VKHSAENFSWYETAISETEPTPLRTSSNTLCYGFIMSHNTEQTSCFIDQFMKKVNHLDSRIRVKLSRWLISQQQSGAQQKGTGHRNSLSFSSRKLSRQVTRSIFQSNTFQ
jgi:hypothetical protein